MRHKVKCGTRPGSRAMMSLQVSAGGQALDALRKLAPSLLEAYGFPTDALDDAQKTFEEVLVQDPAQ